MNDFILGIGLGAVAIAGYHLYKQVYPDKLYDDTARRKKTDAPAPDTSKPGDKVFSPEELAKFDGQEGRPIYICVGGTVFDMSSAPNFYGPGGPYGCFAGHDASRGLAKMSLEAADVAEPVSIADLSSGELDTMNDWKDKFESKYPVMGTLVRGSKL